MDHLSPEQRSRNMKAVKSSGSKIERTLAKALWHKGYRYRKNDKRFEGKPDLTFYKHKVAIFVDSEFWHGKDWQTAKKRIKTNKEFWVKKIERNIQRDKEVNEVLRSQGWTVLRFWGKEIKKKLEDCISEIEETIENVRNKHTGKG